MERINQLMLSDMKILDTVIFKDFNSKVVLINKISQHIISSGGKRIRPLITLLCGRIAGYDNQDNHQLHKMAAMIEYIHTATLLHDDVVDESDLRRGKKTANALFGNAASVLVGDFIYTRAFQMMTEANSIRLFKIMADSTNLISEGEVLQLLNIKKINLTETEYFNVINCKTAKLFESGARVAAITVGASEEVELHLANYAINLGIAFQIVDDILDYIGNPDNTGKKIGGDLEEGKVTLPLIYFLKHAKAKDIEFVNNVLNYPKSQDIKKVIILVKESLAIEYCTKLALDYIAEAIHQLGIFPHSLYKDAMIDLASTSVERLS